MERDDEDSFQAAWLSEYAEWCAEQDDEDEINLMLNEAVNGN